LSYSRNRRQNTGASARLKLFLYRVTAPAKALWPAGWAARRGTVTVMADLGTEAQSTQDTTPRNSSGVD